ncbi:MAG: response regulator [Oscillochloridaceae bacterium umkhey_bin13]
MSRTSLQLRLNLAFILVILIPTLVIAGYSLVRTRAVLLDQIRVEQLRVAEARVAAIESRITEGAADLLFIVQDPIMRRFARGEADLEPELARTFINFLRQAGPRYSSACLLDASGFELVCVRAEDSGIIMVPPSELRNRHDQPFFLGALRQAGIPDGQPVAITLHGPSGAPVTSIDYSLLYPDERGGNAGIVVLEAPLSTILSDLAQPDPSGAAVVIDPNGSILFAAPDSARMHDGGLAVSQPHDLQTILRQPAGTLIDTNDRPGRFQTFARVRPLGQSAIYWTVIYERPLAEILAAVWDTQLVIILITLTVLLAALLISHMLAAGIVRPVKQLAAAAERVGAGDLNTPIPRLGHDELGALATTLDQTVSRLRESLTTAERRRHEAETLRAATEALGSTLDRSKVLELILSELQKVVPYDSASVQEIEGNYAVIIGCYGMLQLDRIRGSHIDLTPGVSPNAEVMRLRTPVILDDGPKVYPLFQSEPYKSDPIRSWIGVPMIFGERLIGMITLDKYEPGYYTTEHSRLALAFAAQAAAAMENTRLYATARRELADRRRAEAAHARLAAIIEATSDLVGMADTTGRLIFMNQAGRQTLAIPSDDNLSSFRVADLFPVRLHTWLRGEVFPTARREGLWAGETTIVARDGNEIPVSQVIIVHRNAQGEPEFISTIVRDMRERRRVEEELRQAQKMDALGRLAGGLAHDFNNLLTVILGEVDLILDELEPTAELRPAVEQIRHSGVRAAALTRQLLAFSRRQVLQLELLDLNEVLSSMEQMLRRLVGEQISLQLELDPNLALVRADPGQIEQVVLNLALNARDAMPQGGCLQIGTRPVHVDAAAAHLYPRLEPGCYSSLLIADTGVGMDATTQSHLFEPFFTTKPRGKGTGLGLATVHGIVRQSGGQIEFISEPEHGTQFTIYLPAALDVPPGEEPEGELPISLAPLPSHETVLLVEDDDAVRGLARQILAREGFRVIEASDGPSACTLAQDHTGVIGMLLTDIMMPGGINGVQLAQLIRAERPQIRVLYMSGYTDNALVERSLADDGAHYLQKPFTPDRLVQAVRETLG